MDQGRRAAARRRREVVRRRQVAVLAAAAVAFLAGIALGAGSGGDDPAAPATPPPAPARSAPGEAAPPAPREAVDELPLTRQVGRLVVLRFAGTSAPGYVREVLGKGRAAGAILFRDNLTDSEQTKALTAQLTRRAAGPPLVMVDQEGGEIRILSWAPPERSAPQQGADGTEREDAAAAARALRDHGINVSLAPVADVASVPGAALSGRAFSTDFEQAAESLAESVRGWQDGRVASTIKHFPGLGGATVNTDDGPATIDRTADQIRDEDLLPFKAGIEAGAPLVMAGHAVYPAIDPDRIASQSQPVIEGLLRDELGFEGVIITDSTEAAAVQVVTLPAEAAVRNIRAGVDIVLTTGRGSYIHVYRALLAEARRDPAFRERVRESAARVIALQRSLADRG
jgi:beta-N-acetylhexosaminidase